MPDSQVIVVMRRQKAALLARERGQMHEMSQRWLDIERALDGQIAALSHEFTRLHLTGGSVRFEDLSRMGRYRALLAQLTRELSNYTDYAEEVITRQQEANAKLAIQHSAAAIDASVTTKIGVDFNRLPIEAVQHMVGLAGDGSPLRNLLVDTWPDAAQGLTQELINGVALGRNPRETAERMVNGTTRSLNRMLNIARTEQLRVYRETSRQSYITSGVVKKYMRLCAHDGRTCISCLMDDGHIYELHQIMPTHPSCVVGGTIVSAATIKGASKRLYSGSVFDIITVRGNHLTVTPNHPILTDKGWVAAQFIQEGDNVIGSVERERPAVFIGPNNQHGPAIIEDVIATLGESSDMSPVSVPVSTEDFHGDGGNSNIAVVWANRLLRDSVQSALIQPRSKKQLLGRCVRCGSFLPDGTGEKFTLGALASSYGGMGRSNIADIFFRGALGHHELIGGRGITNSNLCDFQSAAHNGSYRTKSFGQSILGFTSKIPAGELVYREGVLSQSSSAHFGHGNSVTFGLAPEKTTGLEFIFESPIGGMPTLSDNLHTFAGHIVLDSVLQINQRYFSGHVYNLETESGWYFANGIITHNCRCTQIPVVNGVGAPDWQKGPDWFRVQPETTQESILGKGKFAAWRAGKFDLDSIVKVVRNDVWGDSIQPKTLGELVGT